MKIVATSVRITSDARHVLSILAEKLQRPNAQVIEIALRQLEERVFWDDVSAAFERIANSPDAAAQWKAEANEWDQATAADFRIEEW